MTPTNPAADTMTAGDLRDAITNAMDNSGAYGPNLHPTKDVLIRIGDTYHPLHHVATAFVDGRFVLILSANQ